MRIIRLFGPICILLFLCCYSLKAQYSFTKADYLHGRLTPERTCFDVRYQEISVRVFPETQSITVNNRLQFLVVRDCRQIQLDLFEQMHLDSIVFNNHTLSYKRKVNTVYVYFPEKIHKGEWAEISVYASGKPIVAKKAPWDGGFVWSKDDAGKSWIGLACEGLGASCWLPCKDHWSDEADSVDVRLQVPQGLVGVSNGKLIGEKLVDNGFKEFHWQVRNPINNYNISVNIADYVHLSDVYNGAVSIPLNYYVLNKNKLKAEAHFKQVSTMLDAFNQYFGNYPFSEDGYKLVETPYWGMEHQSCVGYGNNYQNNKWGFDFIIVHESGHEWFGNSVTASDPGDMWIHESFTTYSEALYVEYKDGRNQAEAYLQSQYPGISNKLPVVGPYNVYFHGRTDNDIYYKGSWMLHTLRNVIDNDTLWFNTLRSFAATFEKKNIDTRTVIDFFNRNTQRNLGLFFKQYLYTASLPVFEYKIEAQEDGRLVMSYRWKNAVSGFDMPVKITVTKGLYETVVPSQKWQLIDLNYFDEKDFKIKPNSYLMVVEKMTPNPRK